MRRALALSSILMLPALGGCALLGAASVEEMQLAVGECILNSAVSVEGETEVTSLPRVDCSEPHDGEVYYVEELTELTADTMTEGDETCFAQFEAYVGVPWEESAYYFSSMTPSQRSWDLGDRQLACILVGEEGEQITGSLKGSAS
ncbi:MAG: septum formation family protein [Actinomycetes bacterium]|jgi:hypothetical protein